MSAAHPTLIAPIVGIGKLHAIHYLHGGELFEMKPKDERWLAWRGHADTGDLIVVRKLPNTRVRGRADNIAAMHAVFHGVEPRRFEAVAWYPRPQTSALLGAITKIFYTVPGNTHSHKRGRWRHTFGDMGHAGVSQIGPRAYPFLYEDQDCNVWIVRRPTNIYRLKDWLYG